MELLAPAGNLEKLKYAYLYGADAAYIGIKSFSLRAKADNFHHEEYTAISDIKGRKKLYAALNIFFHNKDYDLLKENLDYLKEYPFDAYIISDLGLLPLLKRHFPSTALHLSTQANCLNKEAARVYYDMGFSRIVLGRECSLDDIRAIKDYTPELEIEAFVHGAMCLAYSGRCFLSAYMADRSANQGDCAHSCRWEYRYLEEKERPGEYFPVIEGDSFTTILSSKDLNLIRHLKMFKDAGVDSLKIEGRMKSLYYAATVTRAYRKAIDALQGIAIADLEDYFLELDKVSHREWTTGFYFDSQDVQIPTNKTYVREFVFLGTIGNQKIDGTYALIVKNQILDSDKLEIIGPDFLYKKVKTFTIRGELGEIVTQADHGKIYTIETDALLVPGYIVRKRA